MVYAPFTTTFTPSLPELLSRLNCTIAITTYQAGKLLFISSADQERLTILPRTFNKPMGFDVLGDRLILATRDEVLLFEDSAELAAHYPNHPATYDRLYLPRITYHTGQVDMHDIAFGGNEILAVNTSFSTICKITGKFNFLPVWKPQFITELVAEDRCHLNGMVILDGKPKYVTMLGHSDIREGWRNGIETGGLLIDIETGETILEGLPMPHSPLWHKGELYMLLSASGQVIRINPGAKKYQVISMLDGFCRGMDIFGDYMFVGMSRLRRNSSVFAAFPFAGRAQQAGIRVIHLPTGAQVGELIWHSSVDEIYGLKILAGTSRPNILNTINPVFKRALAIPGSTFWAPDPGALTEKDGGM